MRLGPLLLPLLLAPTLAVAAPDSRWIPGTSLPAETTATRDLPDTDLPAVAPPPAWMQWLGWSDDSKRIAWRQGALSLQRRPGLPAEVARLDGNGAIVERAHLTGDILAALHARHIRVAPPVDAQQVAPGDVVLRTARGKLLAVVVRGEPAEAAVLVKRDGNYEPVARWSVRSPATTVTAFAWEDAAHRLLAIIATTGRGAQSQAHLVVVPLTEP